MSDRIDSKLKDDSVDFLFEAILKLNDLNECYKFFEDLCTIAELKAMAQRIVVARMLSEQKVYKEIVEATGASTATVSRVNRSLINGRDGYEMLFSRMGFEDGNER